MKRAIVVFVFLAVGLSVVSFILEARAACDEDCVAGIAACPSKCRHSAYGRNRCHEVQAAKNPGHACAKAAGKNCVSGKSVECGWMIWKKCDSKKPADCTGADVVKKKKGWKVTGKVGCIP